MGICLGRCGCRCGCGSVCEYVGLAVAVAVKMGVGTGCRISKKIYYIAQEILNDILSNNAQINTKGSNLIIYTSYYSEKLEINMMGNKWILILFCRHHHH